MTCLSACWLALVLLSTRCVAYYDAGIATEHIHLLKIRGLEPTETVALPPSLTTEVATISTILGRGHAIYYDVYYDTVSAGETHRIVKDHFKRSGVLANEPPIPTCRPCGTQVTSRNVTQQYTYTSGFTTTPCLTPYPYYVSHSRPDLNPQLTTRIGCLWSTNVLHQLLLCNHVHRGLLHGRVRGLHTDLLSNIPIL